MAHVELPQEEFEPLILSMKRVFAPFVDAIPSIIRIPDEIERLSKTIIDDVDSGQPDRLDTASEKLVDPMIQGLKDFYAKQDADREAELAKIAAEREAAIAEVQKLQELGVPAEVTKQNTVNILNEKVIRIVSLVVNSTQCSRYGGKSITSPSVIVGLIVSECMS